jgi:hypothetical protein
METQTLNKNSPTENEGGNYKQKKSKNNVAPFYSAYMIYPITERHEINYLSKVIFLVALNEFDSRLKK